MNSRDRVLAIVTGEKPDRPAFTLTLGLYGARITSCSLKRYYTDPIAFAQGQTAIYDMFQPDVLFGPFAFAMLGAAFGSKVKFFEDQPPTLRKPVISSAVEWDASLVPDPDTNPSLLYIRQAIREMVKCHADQVLVAAILPLPIDIPALIMGVDGWMEAILFEPAMAERVMETIIPFFVTFANSLFDEGAACIVSPCAFASPAIVTRTMATTFARPIIEKTLTQLKGPVVLHHGGAPFLSHLDLLTGIPGTLGFAMDVKDNLKQAREIIGPDPVLMGGPDILSLSRISSREVFDWCRKVLKEQAGDPHFILANSGADIPWNTPPNNIHAFFKSAESFREEE